MTKQKKQSDYRREEDSQAQRDSQHVVNIFDSLFERISNAQEGEISGGLLCPSCQGKGFIVVSMGPAPCVMCNVSDSEEKA